MSAQLKALYELQVIDLELTKTKKARASLDDGSAKKAEVEAARKDVEASDKLLHEATTKMQDKDLNLKTVEAKQKNFRDKLYGGTVSNPKELESMEKEVEMLGRQKGKLEERILELMDIIEERKAALAADQSVLKQREGELAAYLEKLRRKGSALDAQIKDLSTEREQALPVVDAVLLKRYETLRAHAGGVVVSKVENDDCSACHTQITLFSRRELKADTAIETCENCGRMLYLEE